MSFKRSIKQRIKPYGVCLILFCLILDGQSACAQTEEEIKVFFLLSEAHRTLSDLGVIAVFGQATANSPDSSKLLAVALMKGYFNEKLRHIAFERKTDSIGNTLFPEFIYEKLQLLVQDFAKKNGEPFLSHTIYDADSLYYRTYLMYWAPFEAIDAFSNEEMKRDSLLRGVFLSLFEEGRNRFLQFRQKELPKKYAKAYRKLNQQETLESYIDFKFLTSALQTDRINLEEISADEKKMIRNVIYNSALSAIRLIDSGVKDKRGSTNSQGKNTNLTKAMKLWIASEAVIPLQRFAEYENKKQLWRLLALLYAKADNTELAKEALKREKSATPE